MRINKNDTLTYLSKLTPFKIFNAVQVYTSYFITKIVSRPYHRGQPLTASIEPTTSCNLRCPECPSGLRDFSRPTGNIKSSLFQQLIDEIHKKTMNLIFYFQGEPYIHPEFLSMVKYANKKGLYTITSTNGHFLNEANAKKTVESGLSRLIISVDGTTQETYEQYRKEGDLETVLKGAKNVVQQKQKLGSKTPHIIFQFLVVRPNEHQISEVQALATKIGVNEVRIKTAQIYDYKNGNPLIPTIEKYARYKKTDDGSYKLKRQHNIKKHCWKMWSSTVMTWDGKIVPCCFDKDAEFVQGTFSEEKSWNDIWKGDKYDSFRKKITSSRNKINICSNCTEGMNIWQ